MSASAEQQAAIDLVEHRLYRIHYLVVPRLAIQAMPNDWKARLEALLVEADAAGLETPAYTVLRKGVEYSREVPADEDDPHGPLSHVDVFRDDPWSDYRRGDVKALCPGFKEPVCPQPIAAENTFGKTRGRFDEAAARQQDRTLVDAAMAAICAMPEDEFQRFRATFRKVFWRGPELEVSGGRASGPAEVTS